MRPGEETWTNASLFDSLSLTRAKNLLLLWVNRAGITESGQYNQRAPFMIVGNKTDSSKRVISRQEGERLAALYKAPYVETSAKTVTNVEKELSEHGISPRQRPKSSYQPNVREELQDVLAYVQHQRRGLRE